MDSNNGSAYERVTRQITIGLKEDMGEVKEGLNALEGKVVQAFNHMSNRLPWWATGAITGLASLCSALIVRGVYL